MRGGRWIDCIGRMVMRPSDGKSRVNEAGDFIYIKPGVPSMEVTKKLAERGVFLSHGDFYAMAVIERLGQAPHGLVRAGCACYTTSEEVDRLLEGVRGL